MFFFSKKNCCNQNTVHFFVGHDVSLTEVCETKPNQTRPLEINNEKRFKLCFGCYENEDPRDLRKLRPPVLLFASLFVVSILETFFG